MANQYYQFRIKITGPNGPQVFDLPQGAVTLGRQVGNQLLLNDPLVSRQHARIECTSQECQITDLGSANGTLFNGERLAPNAAYPLLPGSLVKIGPFELTLEAEIQEKPRPEASIIDVMEANTEGIAQDKPVDPVTPEIASEKSAEPPLPDNPPEGVPQIQMRVEELKISSSDIPPEEPPGKENQVGDDGLKPLPGSTGYSTRLIQYLPGIYQTDFMSRFLGIFETILNPLEWGVDNFDLFLSSKTTPADFLPWLQSWYGIVFHPSWSEEKRRQLLDEAHMIYSCRGTRKSLTRVLEIYTGQRPRIIDEGDEIEPHTFKVILPFKKGQFHESVIQDIIDGSKPAQTTYTVEYIG